MFAPKQWIKRPILSQKNLWAVCLVLLLIFANLFSSCTEPTDQGISESWDFDGLRLTLSSPKTQYEVGDAITVTAKVENTTEETIFWQSARMDNPDYVFDVYVAGIAFSEIYPELQVSNRQLEPGEKIEITHTFMPKDQEARIIWVKAYIYDQNGTGRTSESIPLQYGYWQY